MQDAKDPLYCAELTKIIKDSKTLVASEGGKDNEEQEEDQEEEEHPKPKKAKGKSKAKAKAKPIDDGDDLDPEEEDDDEEMESDGEHGDKTPNWINTEGRKLPAQRNLHSSWWR